MKNKRIFKHWIKSIWDIVISLMLTYIMAITVREVVILLKRYTQIRVMHYIWELWNKLQYEDIGKYLYKKIRRVSMKKISLLRFL